MRAGLLFSVLLLSACNQNMVQQPRQDDYEPGLTSGKAPQGTVARDAQQREAAARLPLMSAALLRRGQDRYAIYCAMCHGADGRGGGIVAARGFPRPPNLLEPRLIAATPQHVYDVIGQGRGIMYGFADRVPPADRWAMAAYVQALQARESGDAR